MYKHSQNVVGIGRSLASPLTAILLAMQLGAACTGLKSDEETDADGDGFSTVEGDCDDYDVTVNPSASETNDDMDNDCDGETDEGFVDSGGDGGGGGGGGSDTGEAGDPGPDSDEPQDTGDSLDVDHDGDGYSARVDCEDADPSVHPNAGEECDNGVDDDCNGLVDSNDDAVCESDGDGFTTEEGDCDDTNSLIHPGADETCNDLDDDCDGETDEDAEDATTWYRDADSDGYGDEASTTDSCDQPSYYVPASTDYDCDDLDSSAYPGAPETCDDAADNDCDGDVDEECWIEETDTFTMDDIYDLMAADAGGDDDDFYSHGPEVTATFSLSATSTEVEFDLEIWWHEKDAGSTTGFASLSETVWWAPSGCEIVNLDDGSTSGTELSVEIVDVDKDHDVTFVTGAGFVNWISYIGDTENEDLGGKVGSDAELVQASFNSVTVTLTCPAD